MIRRRLLLLASVATIAAPPGGDLIGTPVSIGSHQIPTATSADLPITTSAAASVGDLVIIFVHGGSGNPVTSVTDSASPANTYTVGNTVSVGTRRLTMCWSRLTTALGSGGTITATFGSATGVKFATAAKVSGIAASPLDIQGSGTTGTSSTNPSITTGALAQADEIVFGWTLVVHGDASGDGFTEAAGFTSLTSVTAAGASGGIIRLAYQIVSATSAVTYAPALATPRDWAANYVAFKGA